MSVVSFKHTDTPNRTSLSREGRRTPEGCNHMQRSSTE